MKALNLHKVNDLKYEEIDTPKAAAGEVLVKIHASGICGSDLSRVLTKGTYHFPTVPGHEFSGEIVGVGEGVDSGLIGKRGAVFPLLPCKKCDMCEIGEYAQCKDYNYFGSRCDGGFAEFIAVPLWNFCFASDDVDYRLLAMTEPCAVALHSLRQANIIIGDTVCIFGAGAIGIMLAYLSMYWGADKVILIDIDKTKCDFATKLGFKYVFCGNTADAVCYVDKVTNAKGADITVEGAGVSSSFEGAMFTTKYFGKVVLMGNPNREMTLSQNAYWQIMRKQLALLGTWNSGYKSSSNDWKLVIAAFESGKLNLLPLISHEFPLSTGIKPFEMMRDRKEFFNKVMYVLEEK